MLILLPSLPNEFANMMKEESKSLLAIHIAVWLFGFTAVLGSLITLPTAILVWWRVIITSLSLLVFIKPAFLISFFQSGISYKIIGIGGIVALHWLCFYGSIKWANASLALICMSATSAFTAVLEPILLKHPFRRGDIIVSLLLIPAFIIIAREIPDHFFTGLVLGLGAAILAATFSVLNKKYIAGQDVMTFTFLQLSGASIFVSFLIGLNQLFSWYDITEFLPSGLTQWIYVLILSLACTTLAYVLSLYALKSISAFTSNLVINLEPVYGMILASVIIGDREWMSPNFYYGALFVFLIVMIYPLVSKNIQ